MAREISKAEAWERAHEVFTRVNFSAFDYTTIKESLLDYVKLYYPEDFNDYIESSEFIVLLELFAYVGELMSYRLDMNAHENFITTAQRKESILRLAKLISYKASRNLPARGLVKITSVQTTETVIDSSGRNLAGRRVFWNDTNNSNWKEQFFLIINRVLEQEFGTVGPNERVQVDDVLFELYTLNNNPLNNKEKTVVSYSTTIGTGEAVPMELVPVDLTENGPEEKRPEINAKFSILYASDGLGDSSDTTGFMMFTKQGTLTYSTKSFDGITPNQTFDIEVDNINDIDLWLNNVNPDTKEIISNDPYADLLPHLTSDDLRYGEWLEVDLAHAQNIMFNTNRNRHKFEVETLDRDRVRIIFGDGEFSDIPSGTFHIWYRTSANKDLYIERSNVINKSSSFTYNDSTGSVQSLSFTFSLVSSLQNASASEDIEHIRRVAPSIYYTQDRMVNGRDYNTFLLQDPSILRLRAINRTYAGDSKYIAWHDPRESYEDVKIFGDDLSLYWTEEDPSNGGLLSITGALSSEDVLSNYIEPLLSSTDFFAKIGPILQSMSLNPSDVRRTFNDSSVLYKAPSLHTLGTYEEEAILAALDLAPTSTPIIDLWYSTLYDEWTVEAHPCDASIVSASCSLGDAASIWMIRIEAKFQGSNLSGWDITWRTRHLVAHSENTKFWETNTTDRIVSFNSLNSVDDTIVVLKANINATGSSLLTENKNYKVLAQELVDQNLPDAGLPDVHRISVLPEDLNGDGISDNLLQPTVFDAEFTYTWTGSESVDIVGPYINIYSTFGKKYNISTTKGFDNDISVDVNGVAYSFADGSLSVTSFDLSDDAPFVAEWIAFTGVGKPLPVVNDVITFTFKSFVYFARDSITSAWIPQEESDTIRTLYVVEDEDDVNRLYKREEGRYPLNFAWFHYTPRLDLIDPAASNIIDMFIVTVSYYTAMRDWLLNRISAEPTAPTPLELRTSYSSLLDNKMISDTVVLHSGKFKILFGSKAIPQLRCSFKVIRPEFSNLTDNQVKVKIIEVINNFFDIDQWDFGESFFFTEMAAAIHVELGTEIDSIVLVPTYAQNQFGDMFQVQSREDEIFIAHVTTSDIEIVQSFTPDNIRQ